MLKDDKVTPHMPSGKFSVILADPPWYYKGGGSWAVENHYSTMKLSDIKSLKIPAADSAVLYLWATAPLLPEAIDVMQAWGFVYKSCMVWDKQHISIGYWARGRHEMLLIGTRGKVSPPEPRLRESSVYSEKRTAHSRKPDYYYALLERQHPNGTFLELFARRKYSSKWTVWGYEAPTDDAGTCDE